MVGALIEVAPALRQIFNRSFPLEEQISLIEEIFILEREKYIKTEEGKLKQMEMQKNPRKKGYFFVQRNFSSGMVPGQYKRTESPRLTTTGSTLHGMKKSFKWALLNRVTSIYDFKVVDFDFSGAHANIATRLQPGGSTLLKQSVMSPSFWDERAKFYFPKLANTSLTLKLEDLRASLKVMLYTSLNGGNPFNPDRVKANLSGSDASLGLIFETVGKFEDTSYYKDFVTIFGEDELVQEVKTLNQMCYDRFGEVVYTIDRVKPYTLDSKHKGISRVLQSYEVILLSVLNKTALKQGLLPLSEDHDGFLCLLDSSADVNAVSELLTEGLSVWSEYLLRGSKITVVPKISSYRGVSTKH